MDMDSVDTVAVVLVEEVMGEDSNLVMVELLVLLILVLVGLLVVRELLLLLIHT